MSKEQQTIDSAQANDPGPADPLRRLVDYDVVFVVDDSSSMVKHSRWEEAGKVLETLAGTAMKYDTDGIDIHFLNRRPGHRKLKVGFVALL
jgi:gentisate 1,2-dioxygenase